MKVKTAVKAGLLGIDGTHNYQPQNDGDTK